MSEAERTVATAVLDAKWVRDKRKEIFKKVLTNEFAYDILN